MGCWGGEGHWPDSGVGVRSLFGPDQGSVLRLVLGPSPCHSPPPFPHLTLSTNSVLSVSLGPQSAGPQAPPSTRPVTPRRRHKHPETSHACTLTHAHSHRHTRSHALTPVLRGGAGRARPAVGRGGGCGSARGSVSRESVNTPPPGCSAAPPAAGRAPPDPARPGPSPTSRRPSQGKGRGGGEQRCQGSPGTENPEFVGVSGPLAAGASPHRILTVLTDGEGAPRRREAPGPAIPELCLVGAPLPPAPLPVRCSRELATPGQPCPPGSCGSNPCCGCPSRALANTLLHVWPRSAACCPGPGGGS